MKSATLVGVVLIILGIAALIYQGFSYTKREEVLDIGPIEATKEKTETIPVPPIVGGLMLVGGVALVIASSRGGSAA